MNQVIECIPNFSEGNDLDVIRQIKEEIRSVQGVKLLHVDIGRSVNRTVMTFAGDPEQVIKAAYKAIKKAAELIDMTKHRCVHPRVGATDVCPLVPVSGITMKELNAYVYKLAEKVGSELEIPVYCYEESAFLANRKSLAEIRKGAYEGFFNKIKLKEWIPDYGPRSMNPKAGVTVVGARNFLIAFNINLLDATREKAVRIAGKLRESGITENGIQTKGLLKNVRAIAWYIEEFNIFQISTNILNFKETPVYCVFEKVKQLAKEEHIEVSGSELIGLIPLEALLKTGEFYKQDSDTCSDRHLIDVAIKFLQLNQDEDNFAEKRIVEYLI